MMVTVEPLAADEGETVMLPFIVLSTMMLYPMMSWPHMTRCYMVFGHIHGNTDADYWPLIRENDLMLNAGADVNGFAPVTFEEMQENNYRHKAGWNPELCTMEADQ